MKTFLKYLLCFSLFTTPVVAQSLDCISPLKMCRAGQSNYFQITAGRYIPGFKPKGWQLLVSLGHVSIPWFILGPSSSPRTSTKLYIYLAPDKMFYRSVHCIHSTPWVFRQFRGVLNDKGQGAFEVRLPNVTSLVGQRFFMQVVLMWIPWAPFGCPVQITNPLCVWIHP